MPHAIDSRPPATLAPETRTASVAPLRPPTGEPRAIGERDSGFHARLDGLELWDVVQMECLSGARRVIRIMADNQDGFLFFEGGQVVHAIAGSQVGEPAAMRLLALRNGRCAACEHPWPSRPTIHTPWQGLLLQAAQAMDERRPRRQRPNSGVVRVSEQVDVSPEQPLSSAPPNAQELVLEPDPAEGKQATSDEAMEGDTLDLTAYGQLAWIDAQGDVIQEHGDDPDFSGAAAYATRLAHLTGEMLGLGEFLAMECRSQTDTRFVYRDEHGGVVACQPKTSATAVQLRKRLGL